MRGRRSLLPCVLVALALPAGCRPDRRPPNVVLIAVDTLRADRVNVYGYQRRRLTPHIDALARDGIVFESHVAAAPWTTPSQMSLLTSLSPSAHGVTVPFHEAGPHPVGRLAAERVTLAERLAGAGWATAAFTGGGTMDPDLGFGDGFSVYDESMMKMNGRGLAAMLAWIDASADRPFFVLWHTFEVHSPYLQARFAAEVTTPADDELLRRVLERLARQPRRAYGQWRPRLSQLGLYSLPVCDALYDGGVASFDRWVGRLVDGLEERNLYDHTLIVFTSDHGEQRGEDRPLARAHGAGPFDNQHGHALYQEQIHVPLIVKLPGQDRAGTRVRDVTRTVDVMPTILDVAGVAGEGMQGTSLRAAWSGGGPELAAVAEALSEDYEEKAVRFGRHKYVVHIGPAEVRQHGRAFVPRDPRAPALYDLAADPGERRNLLAAGAAEGRWSELAARLHAVLAAQVGTGGRAEPLVLDLDTRDRLRALGYIDARAR
jgi:arylsulfatase A-like enzyme